MSDDAGPDPALERLFEEARRTVDKQIQVGEGLDARAAELLRFEALLLGIVLTGVSVVLRTQAVPHMPWWLTGCLLTAFSLIVTSTLLAVRSYELREVHFGVHSNDLVSARVGRAAEEEVMDAALRGYAQGIQRNGDSLDAASERLDLSVRLLWLGLVALSLATVILMLLGARP